MANLIRRSRGKEKMFLGKSKQLKQSPKKSILDQVLWFVENYLPKKKSQQLVKESQVGILGAKAKNLKKSRTQPSRSSTATATNTKVSITLGNWASPYLKVIKRIGFLK